MTPIATYPRVLGQSADAIVMTTIRINADPRLHGSTDTTTSRLTIGDHILQSRSSAMNCGSLGLTNRPPLCHR